MQIPSASGPGGCAGFADGHRPRHGARRTDHGARGHVDKTGRGRGYGAQAQRVLPGRSHCRGCLYGPGHSRCRNREPARFHRDGAEHVAGRGAKRRQRLHYHSWDFAGAQQRAFGRGRGGWCGGNQPLRVQPGTGRYQADRGVEGAAGRAVRSRCHRWRHHHHDCGPIRAFRGQCPRRCGQWRIREGPDCGQRSDRQRWDAQVPRIGELLQYRWLSGEYLSGPEGRSGRGLFGAPAAVVQAR